MTTVRSSYLEAVNTLLQIIIYKLVHYALGILQKTTEGEAVGAQTQQAL